MPPTRIHPGEPRLLSSLALLACSSQPCYKREIEVVFLIEFEIKGTLAQYNATFIYHMALDLRYGCEDLLVDDMRYIAIKSAAGRDRGTFGHTFLGQCFKRVDPVTDRQLVVIHRVDIECSLNG